MLPKGNVSKHHARLLFRDNRFIVTDLKSTNGTYVNGRKIAQATIVREGDKIYIGDFVLRLDSASAAQAPEPESGEDPSRTLDRGAMLRAPAAPPALPGGDAPPPPPAPPSPPPPIPWRQPSPRRSEPAAVSHFPLERDPDDSQSAPSPTLSSSPRSPTPRACRTGCRRRRLSRRRVGSPSLCLPRCRCRSNPRSWAVAPSRSEFRPGAPVLQPQPRRCVAALRPSVPPQCPPWRARVFAASRAAAGAHHARRPGSSDAIDLSPLRLLAAAWTEGFTQAVERTVRDQAQRDARGGRNAGRYGRRACSSAMLSASLVARAHRAAAGRGTTSPRSTASGTTRFSHCAPAPLDPRRCVVHERGSSRAHDRRRRLAAQNGDP